MSVTPSSRRVRKSVKKKGATVLIFQTAAEYPEEIPSLYEGSNVHYASQYDVDNGQTASATIFPS